MQVYFIIGGVDKQAGAGNRTQQSKSMLRSRVFLTLNPVVVVGCIHTQNSIYIYKIEYNKIINSSYQILIVLDSKIKCAVKCV